MAGAGRLGGKNGLERGRKIRVDATAVESDIRYPTDSPLLCNAIRVVTRLLKRLRQRQLVSWVDHSRRAQRRCLNSRNSRGKKREQHYRDLLKGACKTRGYAHRTWGQGAEWTDPLSQALAQELAHYLELMERVIEQTRRRVLAGEKVPASEKGVSLFEAHTDLIQKGNRESPLGHKRYLSVGKTALILDALLVRGNPADRQQVKPLLKRRTSTGVPLAKPVSMAALRVPTIWSGPKAKGCAM